MKRLISIFTLLAILVGLAVPAHAAEAGDQEGTGKIIPKKERRVFLWDVTISMIGATQQPGYPKGTKRSKPSFDYTRSNYSSYNKDKDIFDQTRQKLINLINAIQTESTEIIVLPFRNGIVGEFKADATAAGKSYLKNCIMDWDDLQEGGTHTGTSLQKAIGYFTPDRRNHVILLTDGDPSGGEGTKLLSILNNWNGEKTQEGTGNRLTYVMLTQEAANQAIEEIAKGNPSIDVVGPDQPIDEHTSLSLGQSTSIHVRDFYDGKVATNGKGTFELSYKIDGPALPNGYKLHFTVEENEFVQVDTDAAFSGNSFVVPFSLLKSLEDNIQDLPHDSNLTLTLTFNQIDGFKNVSVVDSHNANLELVLKAEPRVKISFRPLMTTE